MVPAPCYPNAERAVSATEMHKISPILTGSCRKKCLFAAAIGLLLCGCGAAGPGAGSHPSPAPTAHVNVTEQDHTATIHVGEKLRLALHAANGMSNWTHPESNDRSVLAPAVEPAATAAVGVTLAAFVGMKPGTVEVTATASPKCPPNSACPMLVALYSLKVTVTQ